MENHEKSPGMYSDRPEITPNVLPLDGSSHVLERDREGGEMLLVGLCGGRKGTHLYESIPADPTALRRRGLSAISRQTVRL
jgi:hypothetical protein